MIKRRDELVEIMFNNYFYCHRINELNEIKFIDEGFNNSINYLINVMIKYNNYL